MKKSVFLLIILFLVFKVHADINPIKIGFIAGFSGSDPNTANELYKAVDIFFKHHPELKAKIRIEKIDNKGDVSETYKAIDSAFDKGIRLFVGIANSDEAIAASKIIQKRNGLLITPFATNPKVTEKKLNIFRVCYTDDQQGKFLAEFAKAHFKDQKLLVLTNITSSYSLGLTESFLKHFDGNANQVTYSEPANEQKKLEQIVVKEKPSLIFIPDHITRASLLVRGLSKVAPNAIYLGGDGFGGQKIFLSLLGDSKKITAYYSTHWHQEIKNRVNQEFINNYKKLFPGADPTSGTALSLDALEILALAIKNAGVADPKLVAKAIKKAKYQTTVGLLEFLPHDNSPIKPILLMRYKEGHYSLEGLNENN